MSTRVQISRLLAPDATTLFGRVVLYITGALMVLVYCLQNELTGDQYTHQPNEPHVIKLVRLPTRSREGLANGGEDAYVGRVVLGNPGSRELRMMFNTASGNTVLPSTTCTTNACLQRRRFPPSNAPLAPMMTRKALLRPSPRQLSKWQRDSPTLNVSSLNGGLGNFKGDPFYETICIGENGRSPCASLGVVMATEIPERSFEEMPYDGVVGLGLDSLSVTPIFSFVDRIFHKASGMKQQFAFFAGAQYGELALGGYSQQHLASALSWVSVLKPEEGYWQVPIRSVRVGNRTLYACTHQDCRGILDTSVSHARLPPSLARELKAYSSIDTASAGSKLDCGGPDLQIDLDENITMTLECKDYWGPKNQPGIFSSDSYMDNNNSSGILVLGQAFMRSYYTVFDVAERKIGFGRATALESVSEEADTAVERRRQEQFDFAQADDPEESVDELLLTGILQNFSMLLAVCLYFTRRQWSTKLQKLRANAPFDVSHIDIVPQGEAPAGDECAICLGSCEEGQCEIMSTSTWWRRLPCKHQFHETCIFEWLRKSDRCPVCRRSIAVKAPGAGLATNAC